MSLNLFGWALKKKERKGSIFGSMDYKPSLINITINLTPMTPQDQDKPTLDSPNMTYEHLIGEDQSGRFTQDQRFREITHTLLNFFDYEPDSEQAKEFVKSLNSAYQMGVEDARYEAYEHGCDQRVLDAITELLNKPEHE